MKYFFALLCSIFTMIFMYWLVEDILHLKNLDFLNGWMSCCSWWWTIDYFEYIKRNGDNIKN